MERQDIKCNKYSNCTQSGGHPKSSRCSKFGDRKRGQMQQTAQQDNKQ
jgi:hypothetical protein